VLSGVAGEEGSGEVSAGDREADAHIAAALVPETRVDADVDRLAESANVRIQPRMSISSLPFRAIVSIVLTIPRWASSMLEGIAAWPSGCATKRLKISYPGFIQRRHSGMIESRKRLVCS
jgi:hypothetical protein